MNKKNELSGEPLRVLLVEDDLGHVELIKRSLKDHQVANKVYHVGDGEAALDYLFRRGRYADSNEYPMPHIVLLDLRLPRIDGLEVLKEIKASEQLGKIPVVVLTTSEAEKDMTKAYENNANSYLVKPIDFAKFTKMLNDLGLYWLGWNRHPWNDK